VLELEQMTYLTWLGLLSVTFDCMLEIIRMVQKVNRPLPKQGVGYKKITKAQHVPRDTIGKNLNMLISRILKTGVPLF